jgi:hypothetical protein
MSGFSELGVAAAMGAAAIVVLVVIAGRAVIVRRRARPRSRPASPEVDVDRWYVDRERDRLRKILAKDYRKQTRHDDKD